MNQDNFHIIFILGFPSSGKSTLGKKLATLLKGIHISVGDLIRERLTKNQDEAALFKDAFQGKEMFPSEWIAKLLKESLSSVKQNNYILVDAGPPLDEVIKKLDINPICVIYINSSAETCKQRFLIRQKISDVERNDDILELFTNRIIHYKNTLPNILSKIAQFCFINKINGNVSLELVVRQALSCIYCAMSQKINKQEGFYYRTEPNIENIINKIKNFTALTLKADKPFILFNKSHLTNNIPMGNQFLLLLKPPFYFEEKTFCFINNKLHNNGYEIYAISIWKGCHIRNRNVAKAHFELHYFMAAYGIEIIPPYILKSINPANKPIINAYEMIQKSSLNKLNKVWENASIRRNISRSFWLIEEEEYIILNGHIPTIINQFHDSANVYALYVRQSTHDAKNWEWLRCEFLGYTNPIKAHQGSLRRLAYEKRLNLHEEVSFNNNGFHLSSGPFEAHRELSIWFGLENCIQSAENKSLFTQLACDYIKLDHDTNIIYSMLENCENLNFQSSQIAEWIAEKIII